jgi:hypothetical protein
LLSLILFLLFFCLRRLRPGAKLDDELAIEGGGDARQGVDPGRPRPSLHPGDRGLRSPAELGELPLRDSPSHASLRDALCDQAEQLSIFRI